MATGAVQARPDEARQDRIRIKLAEEASFQLGPLTVDPALRRIAHADGREEIVEPRVMQVLVALIRAGGGILSRDALIESCWDGRIVGEDAINRVMSRLRRVADTVGEGLFHIETLTKVGYRLVLADGVRTTARSAAAANIPADAAGPSSSRFSWLGRRRLIAGLAATAVAAGAPAAWTFLSNARRRWGPHEPTPEAKRLYDAGMQAQYFALNGTTEQAEAYFRQAAEADPEWPDAWGSLAMSYRHAMDGETTVAQWRLVEQTRAAAKRALDLDPDNAEALVALALIRSFYRRWREAEAEYRPLLERFPQAFVLRGHLGRLLRDVGRYSEAVEQARVAREAYPLVAFTSIAFQVSLWGAGRLHEAHTEAEQSIARWPKNPVVWFHYADYLTFSGRAAAAVGFASDPEARPVDVPPRVLDRRVVTARAVATRSSEDIAAAVRAHDELAQRMRATAPYVLAPHQSVPFYAAIGDLDTAFAYLDGYYFNRGRLAASAPPEQGPLTRRDSFYLFLPHLAPLRADARFGALVQEIGLEDYWRRAGLVPDFRRVAS